MANIWKTPHPAGTEERRTVQYVQFPEVAQLWLEDLLHC